MISEKTPYLNYRLSFVFTVFLPRYLSQNFNEHAENMFPNSAGYDICGPWPTDIPTVW
jgi:hypothetical protein